MFGTTKQQLEVIKRFRSLLSTDSSSTINKVIGAGLVPKLVEFLKHDDIDLQYQAICAFINITAESSLQTKSVIDAGALPVLVELLSSQSENVQENAVSCLGNIAGNGPEFRDLTLDHAVLSPLLKYVNKFDDIYAIINIFFD